MSKQSDQTRWMLDGKPPGPAVFKEPKPVTAAQGAKVKPSATHTGTDPLGRAIGPAEDHTKIKPVLDPDGRKVTPNADGTLPKRKS